MVSQLELLNIQGNCWALPKIRYYCSLSQKLRLANRHCWLIEFFLQAWDIIQLEFTVKYMQRLLYAWLRLIISFSRNILELVIIIVKSQLHCPINRDKCLPDAVRTISDISSDTDLANSMEHRCGHEIVEMIWRLRKIKDAKLKSVIKFRDWRLYLRLRCETCNK